MKVRIVGASGRPDMVAVEKTVTLLRNHGWATEFGPRRESGFPYLNGTDGERRDELLNALNDDSDVVWFARGGYGLARLLDDFPDISTFETPKTLVGFSDVTAFFCYSQRARLLRNIHGPLATNFANEPDRTRAHLLSLIENPNHSFSLEGRSKHRGTVSGHLFAANLSVLVRLLGTRHFPNLKGAILCVEDVGERPYRIDALWTQLLSSNKLDACAAVVLGHFTSCEEVSGRPPIDVDVVSHERLARLAIPVASGFPFGHEAPNFGLPNGARFELRCDNGRAFLGSSDRVLNT